ncbi:MAG: heavy metal translocating P-type ATPase [Oscillospiraceae bacterium]|nr:heavy metal translocating P-type ATPase [Oscillospiraceae bacterium]
MQEEKQTLKRDIIIILLGAALFVGVWIYTSSQPNINQWLMLGLFLVPYLVLGFEIISDAIIKLLHGELFDEYFLMTVASIGALCIGEYPEAVAVMLFFRIGECFEDYAVDKSRRSIAELMDIRPDYACVEVDGVLQKFDPNTIPVGTVITVTPGERIPLDGVIMDGESSVDTSALTGESMPRTVKKGQQVVSGCVNLSGVLRIRVSSTYKESTVSKMLELVEHSANSKSRREALVTRFAKVYTPVVVALAVLLAVIPSLVDGNWLEWIRRALIFLVISCPCALVISVPLSFFGGIGCASKHGILIKGSTYLEALADTSTVVMDKTGTVTEGSFSVTGVEPIGISGADLITLAAAAECYSSHPIALSLRKACKSLPDRRLVTNVRELTGRGIEANVCGRRVLVGNAALMTSNGITPKTPTEHATIVHVAADGIYGGYIVIDDRIKDGAKQAVSDLYRLGVESTVMLTGDGKRTAQAVATALGVNNVYSELLPSDKVIAVEELLRQKHTGTLLFVGDGINDAPVLARSDVGIAMGALGSDAAVEAADVVLMDDDVRKLPLAIEISQHTVGIAKQNIAFSLTVKFVIMLLGALGIAGMWLAVFADVGVLILAVLNATRTLRINEE